MRTVEELKDDLEELKKLYKISQNARVQQFLALEIRRVETMILEKDSTSFTYEASKSPAVKSITSPTKITTYGWDQSDKFVKLYITLPNVHTIPLSQVNVDFQSKSFALSVSDLDGKNYTLSIINLLYPILPSSSQFKVKKDSILIMLYKTNKRQWTCLTEVEFKSKEKKPPKIDNSDDPNKGLMDIMKQMYEDGDDETKRTIAKAWTESRQKAMGSDAGF